jgi:hypothetical protein
VIDDDAAARALQKAFAEDPGPSVARVDEYNALFTVVHGKQDRTPVRNKKNMTSLSKNKQLKHNALRLFKDPIRSPVNSKFLKKTTTNTIYDPSPGLAIIDTPVWQKFSDPFNPTILATVKEAADKNVWYSFLYDVFLDGGGVTLGRRKYHLSLHDTFRYYVCNCRNSRPLVVHDISVCIYAAFA